MMFFFLAVFSISLCVLLQKFKTNKSFRLPPGPRGLPLIGNLHQLDNSFPHRYLWHLSQKYGPIMSLRLGFVPAVVISSAKMAKEVMKTRDLAFSSRPSLLGQQKLSYNGLDIAFAPYNDYWREMRKICVLHLFNSTRVQCFRSIREDEVSFMIEKMVNSAYASNSVNLSEAVMALTSSIICRVAFGKKYEDGGSERSRFHSLLNEAQAMMASFYVSDYFPYTKWIDKLTGLVDRLEKIFNELDVFYQEFIDQHLDPKRPKTEQEDITDVLLRVMNEQSFTTNLTLDHIKAVLMNILVGGTDTCGAGLVWAMTALMKNQAVMRKVQEEVRNLVGKEGKFVNEDNLLQLPYLKAVVKETMRLHPPVPLLVPRETTKTCNIEGYDVPAKTLVYVSGWAIGRDPEAWKEPDRFNPERFLGSSIDFKGQDYELTPFGARRRGCPRIYMGAVTMELALANLLYRFDWEMPAGMKEEDIDVDVMPGVTMHKKNPLCLVPRNNYM